MRLRSPREWNLEALDPPAGTSFLAHTEQLLAQQLRGPLRKGGEPLPDDEPPASDGVGWAPGARDAVVGGGAKGNDPVVAAAAVLDFLRHAPDNRRLRVVLERLDGITGPAAADRLVDAVRLDHRLDHARLAQLARWLCEHGTTRTAVKGGIALLGIAGSADDVALIKKLGLLEELTLYAVVALQRVSPDPAKSILALAREVDGWGRINAIRRLKDSDDEEVRAWLLRGGAGGPDELMEIALIAATTGRLADALERDADEALLDGAGSLLSALVGFCPGGDISRYEDVGRAMRAYVRRVSDAPVTLGRTSQLYDIYRYLGSNADNAHLDQKEREDLKNTYREVLRRPEHREAVRTALIKATGIQFNAALVLAKPFNFDATRAVRERLLAAPWDLFLWQWFVASPDVDRVRAGVTLAEEILPLHRLATGASASLGFGPQFDMDTVLGYVVSRLEPVPDTGWNLIRTALSNRVVGNRRTAVRVLKSRPIDTWPAGVTETIRELAWRDPADDVRSDARELAGAFAGPRPER